MLVQYRLEASAIAINKERTKYALMSKQELGACNKPITSFCEIKSPIYPVNVNRFCIVALLMKNERQKKKKCQIVINPNELLPIATHLSAVVLC